MTQAKKQMFYQILLFTVVISVFLLAAKSGYAQDVDAVFNDFTTKVDEVMNILKGTVARSLLGIALVIAILGGLFNKLPIKWCVTIGACALAIGAVPTIVDFLLPK